MAFDNLLFERDGAVATVTLNRPKVLNALNAATLDELHRAFDDVARDSDTRVVIITGAGDRAFAAGADIKEFVDHTPVSFRDLASRGQHLLATIEHLGKPVIAAVNGLAFGGGCELVMACTLRIAADVARFGQPEINLGLLPGYAGTQRLTRLVGKGRALDMMLSGAPITAAEAERIGLVNRVVPAAELMEHVRSLALTLATKPPIAVRYILEAVNRGLEMSFDDGCALEATLFGLTAATDDMREGIRAFLEKRPARFQGR